MVLKELIAKLVLDSKGFIQGSDEANKALNEMEENQKKLKESSEKLGKILGGVWDGIGKTVSFAVNAIKVASLGIAAGLTAATYAATKYEEAMYTAWQQSMLGAEAAGDAWENYQLRVLEASSNVQTYVGNMIKALTEVGDAGYKGEESFIIMEQAAKLAKARAADYGSTAELVARSLRMFEDQNLTAAEAVNYLAYAADGTELSSMGMALNSLLPIASSFKWKFQEVVGVFGQLASRMQATRAQMALGLLMNEMAEESSNLGKALTEVGIKVKNSQGDMRPFLDILIDMQKKSDAFSKAYKGSAMTIGAVTQLLKMDFSSLRKEMASTLGGGFDGSLVDKMLANRQKTLAGTFENFLSSGEQLLIEIGEGFKELLIPVLDDLSERIMGIVNYLRESDGVKIFFETLGEYYEEKVKPALDDMGEKFTNLMDKLTSEQVEGWADSVISGLELIGRVIEGLLNLAGKVGELASIKGPSGMTSLQKEGTGLVGAGLGAYAGATQGLAAGSTIGSVAGPIGTAVGGTVGSLGGGLLGALGGYLGGKGISELWDKLAGMFKKNDETNAKASENLSKSINESANQTRKNQQQLGQTYVEGFQTVSREMEAQNRAIRKELNQMQARLRTLQTSVATGGI